MLFALPSALVAEPEKSRRPALQRLARDPGDALRHWARLDLKDSLYVLSYMKQYYDQDFVNSFLERAKAGKRPDAVLEITNDPRVTPERLRAAGYRPAGSFGTMTKWMHPSGKELWLLPPPKAGGAPDSPSSSAPRPQVPPPLHPDVQDAQSAADSLEAERDALWEAAVRLQSQKTADGSYPAGPFNDYFRRLKKFQDDLRTVLDEEAALWQADALTAPERELVNKQVGRMKQLEKFPPEMEELGAF